MLKADKKYQLFYLVFVAIRFCEWIKLMQLKLNTYYNKCLSIVLIAFCKRSL
jgi:hypothetical protein